MHCLNCWHAYLHATGLSRFLTTEIHTGKILIFVSFSPLSIQLIKSKLSLIFTKNLDIYNHTNLWQKWECFGGKIWQSVMKWIIVTKNSVYCCICQCLDYTGALLAMQTLFFCNAYIYQYKKVWTFHKVCAIWKWMQTSYLVCLFDSICLLFKQQ